MGGLTKPLSRREATNPRGVICARRGKDGNAFISSYHDSKESKRRQQMKQKMKKYLAMALLALTIMTLLNKSKSSDSASAQEPSTVSDESSALRGSSASDQSNIDIVPEVVAASAEVKIQPEKSTVTGGGGTEEAKAPAATGDASITKGANVVIDKGLEKVICGTEIPINLAEVQKWPTPFTPLLGDGKVPSDSNAKEVVLLNNGDTYGGIGAQLNSFFHAYDVAYQRGRPLYITQDSWAIKALLTLFFGPSAEKNAKLWKTLESILRVKIVESENVLKSMGITYPDQPTAHSLFYHKPEKLTPTQIRNHRETILRKLLQYPPLAGGPKENACSTLKKLATGADGERYTVMHLVSEGDKAWLKRLEEITKMDHSAATEMEPAYVKNILTQTEMLDQPMFPIYSEDMPQGAPGVARLSQDPQLKKLIKVDQNAYHFAGKFYLAVLADVYLGSPVDQLSLWIARMRHALDIGNTFVLTEKEGNNWVSYPNFEEHLEFYADLGPWSA
mmetsp:Transcript_9288/g.20085  ORF Transcript_9288/g.20085 Transcript_9288/m.20085 type:complete len:504 (+) Transcript_9288:119-1630(+)